EGKMLQTFQAIGRNPYTLDIDAIREFVEAQGRVKPEVLRKHFQHVASPKMLEELITFLIVTGDLVEMNRNGVITIEAKRR
ncbi:hypothetical protein LCGC14_3169810, partial [marine sediment metagenome]